MHRVGNDAILAKQDTARLTFDMSESTPTTGGRSQPGSEEDRQAYFSRRELTLLTRGQATTIQELLDIRASRSEWLRERTLATAVGVRIRNGQYTDRPAILAFVFSKVHPNWLPPDRLLPPHLEGEGSLWCDLDVLEFACLPGRQPARDRARAEEESSELVDDLRGCSAVLGPGSQVACDDTFVTMGPIVVDSSAPYQLGFLTNCHVAGTSPEMSEGRCLYHPHCPSHGPGVPIGEVRRVVSFRSDLEWFGFYINQLPAPRADIRVRVDGAFATFDPTFHAHHITARPRGLPPGAVGPVLHILPAWPVTALVSQQVAKVGRSSGLTRGTVMAYAVEYYVDSKRAFASDLLIRSSNEIFLSSAFVSSDPFYHSFASDPFYHSFASDPFYHSFASDTFYHFFASDRFYHFFASDRFYHSFASDPFYHSFASDPFYHSFASDRFYHSFASDPFYHSFASDPFYHSFASDPFYHSFASDPFYHSFASDTFYNFFASDRFYHFFASDRFYHSFASDPFYHSFASDPFYHSFASDPFYHSFASDPFYHSFASDPFYHSFASDPFYHSFASDPFYHSFASDPFYHSFAS
ncbi:unnamed protein product [Closterium sp. Yama58-4]|nr:unnamed protein product [Closterium sp. Yama58-4]